MSVVVGAHDFYVIPFSVITNRALTGLRVYTVSRISDEAILTTIGAYVEYRKQVYALIAPIHVYDRESHFWPLDDVAEHYNFLFHIRARLVKLSDL